MRETTKAAGPTQQVLLQGLPEQKGPELRAPPPYRIFVAEETPFERINDMGPRTESDADTDRTGASPSAPDPTLSLEACRLSAVPCGPLLAQRPTQPHSWRQPQSWNRGTGGSGGDEGEQRPPGYPGCEAPDRGYSPQDHAFVGLQAAQVMIGVIHCALGHIWLHLYFTQFEVLSVNYNPFTLLSGYPLWAFFFYVTSGVLAIETERRRSPYWLKYAITTNTNSSVLAVIGLILVGFEITFFLVKQRKMLWPEQIAIILSIYLWTFSILELLLATKVVELGNQAIYRRKCRM
ncbi:uncharacterized protein [Vicugna pacos]|uniref:Uncharacterized protein n=1 Tax=Vicugna pacos TaxID=30538 RepID=A0ABM5E103_VICPA